MRKVDFPPLTVVLLAFLSYSCANSFNRVLSYLPDEEFNRLKSTDKNFAVFLHTKNDFNNEKSQNALKSINQSASDLQKFSVQVGLIDCDSSRLTHCRRADSRNHALIYRNGDIVQTVSSENLQTPVQALAYLKHYLLLENLVEINDQKQYNELQKESMGHADLFLFYLPSLGSPEHLEMIDRTFDIPNDVVVCLTMNRDICEHGDTAWYLSCSVTAEGDKCATKFSTSDLSEASFNSAFSSVNPVTLFKSQTTLKELLKSLVNKGQDVLLLIAGDGKFKKTLKLANEFSGANNENTSCVVVNSQDMADPDQMLSSRIQDNKIFLSVSPAKLGSPVLYDFGFMENEDLKDVMDAFHSALSDPYFDKARLNSEEGEMEDIVPEFIRVPEEIQDDPITYSVHNTKDVRDLYYFDYNTIPRLTDKTYVEVTRDDKYAVILFTLEFNSRALATLLGFVQIHLRYIEHGASPLYRVECYSWPDVCQKAGVYTSPRMFFYPAGSTERIEYYGSWDEESMQNAITRYSLPTVIEVKEQKEFAEHLNTTKRSIVGLFKSHDEIESFREAAEVLKSDFLFIKAHGEVAKSIAEQYKVSFQQQKLLAFQNAFVKAEEDMFENKGDVVTFVMNAFALKGLQQLTIHNFVKVLQDPKPLLIYFHDARYDEMLKNTVKHLSHDENLAQKVLFTKMDASSNTTGEFVLNKYNSKAKLQTPIIAFFNKKDSVMLRSCSSEDCGSMATAVWLQKCIDGDVEATYVLTTEEWKPRLAGFDFIEIMKAEDMFPKLTKWPKVVAEEEDEKKSSGRGRTIAAISDKPKKEVTGKMDNNAVKSSTEPVKDMKQSPHSEL